jgi:Dolichyl-phosphate-mannose-protein mannosyltransferase
MTGRSRSGVTRLRAADDYASQSSDPRGVGPARRQPADETQSLEVLVLLPGVGQDPAAQVLVEPAEALTYPADAGRLAADDELGGSGWRHNYRLGLLAILVVQAALALRLVWSNTAFADEAEYIWYGHMEWQHWLHGSPLPQYYLSGAPQIYPPLGALADSALGLAGARLLSLVFMLGTTALLHATAARLFSRRAGLIGAAMFVAVGPTADLGAWATYDPMAICLMALASWLAVRAAQSRVSEAWILLSAAAMVLADATKWVTALWSPVIVALVVLTAPTGWGLAVARGFRLVAYAVAVGAPALLLAGGGLSVTAISATTTQRGSGGDAWLAVLWLAAPLVAMVLAVALLGVLLACREQTRRRPLLCVVLVVAVLLAPAFQAYDQTTVSLYKHVVFGLWFGAMAAGYALSKAVVVSAAKGWRIGMAAVIFTGLLGFDQASGWYGFWPNSVQLVAAVEHDLPARGPIMMQGGDQMVANYYLYRQGIRADIITSYAYAPDAVSAMIESHQVWMVETDTGTGIPPGSIQESVAGTPAGLEQAGYRRAARIRWRDPDGAVGWFTIWLLAGRR